MRYTLLLTALILTSISVNGQSKILPVKMPLINMYCDTCRTLSATTQKLIIGASSLPPSKTFFIGSNINIKPWLIIHNPTQDSVIMNFRKSQIKWLNDSTAVIYKP